MAIISEKEIEFNKEISEILYGNDKKFDEVIKIGNFTPLRVIMFQSEI